MREIYKNYSNISNCSKDFKNINQLHYYYELEMRRFKDIKNLSILEIGFGNGSYINWCTGKNYNISGYEVNDVFYKNAIQKYKNIFFGKKNQIHKTIKNKFDLIILFDVIEHIKKDELVDFLIDIRNSLKSKGNVFLRFPNGSSLAGLEYFNADLTHYSFLNSGSLKMLCDLVGFKVIECDNMKRIKKFNSLKGKIFGRLNYFIRDIIEFFYGYLYHNERIPLDPNLVAVLEKNE